MSLQKYVDLSELKTEVEVYDKNHTFRDIADIMENEQFREFFEKYSKPSICWKTMNMMMHMYSEIEKRSHQHLTKQQKVQIMKEALDNPEIRQQITQKYLDFEK